MKEKKNKEGQGADEEILRKGRREVEKEGRDNYEIREERRMLRCKNIKEEVRQSRRRRERSEGSTR